MQLLSKIHIFLKEQFDAWLQDQRQIEEISEEIDALEPNIKPWSIEPLLLCVETKEELESNFQCFICLDETIMQISGITTNCQHTFCKHCIVQHLDIKKNRHESPCCPVCRTHITTVEIKDPDYYEELRTKYTLQTI